MDLSGMHPRGVGCEHCIYIVPFCQVGTATFRSNGKIEVEFLVVENYCKGGSEYSRILNSRIFKIRTTTKIVKNSWTITI